jgi:hypothetical protein
MPNEDHPPYQACPCVCSDSPTPTGVRLGIGLRTAVRALASRVIARGIGTFGCAVGWVAVVRIWPRAPPAEPSREKIGCTYPQPASWWTVAAATSGLSSKTRRTAKARSCAARLGLVNGFVTMEFNDGSMSGQLGDDRSERISGVGADNDVGEAAVLPPPQDLLGGRRRVAREYQERVRRA